MTDTPALTAEERACSDAILIAMDRLSNWLAPATPREVRAQLREAIVLAIRDHEDAAYERAAHFCDEEAKLKDSAVFADRAFGRREAGRRMGRMIRSLKSKKD